MNLPVIKVKRDGPRGWHWINRAKFDEGGYEEYVAPGDMPQSDADTNDDGELSAAELKAALDAKGIPYKGNASKTVLKALLDGAT